MPTDETTELLERGCKKETITYLGDGVYAGFDGYQIWLTCRRQAYFHSIALDEQTYINLCHFANKIHNSSSSESGEHQVVLDALREC